MRRAPESERTQQPSGATRLRPAHESSASSSLAMCTVQARRNYARCSVFAVGSASSPSVPSAPVCTAASLAYSLVSCDLRIAETVHRVLGSWEHTAGTYTAPDCVPAVHVDRGAPASSEPIRSGKCRQSSRDYATRYQKMSTLCPGPELAVSGWHLVTAGGPVLNRGGFLGQDPTSRFETS
ncbi:hypothetical protein OH76DRAFT_1562381 [Lentinus brumalis]|uniref:Uncharacterized protein n=1 Tax=Lentinus brumalis TaxID=2498619 RepID=A0A371CGW3_9APHY|nr:hypothetical protein OH76DRAFT_1562381 [Polyporus brumalis]